LRQALARLTQLRAGPTLAEYHRMHRSEARDIVACLACGEEVSLGVDRVYAVTDDSALCFACAIKRGGAYNEAHDEWTKVPDLSGLTQSADV
jgi:hypothetical protein